MGERRVERWTVDQREDGHAGWPVGSDRRQFALLVRGHGPAVHSYLARRAGRHVADDLFSEVWLRAWRSRDSYDPTSGAVLPWLYGVARNTLRAHFRLRVENYGSLFELHCDPWPEIDDRLDAARVAISLERAVSSLSEENREILLLVAWEQLSPAEIAQSLQMSQSTVRSRLHRARMTVREYLDAELESPGTPDPQEVC